jgi:hypothetical protein
LRSQKPSLLQGLLDILESILDAVSLSISLHEENRSNRRTRPQDNTAHTTTGCQDSTFTPLRVVIESTPPPPSASEAQKAKEAAEERRKQNAEEREGRKFVAEVIIAFITAFLLVVNVWLVLTTRHANKIAENALAITKKSQWLQQRAWLNLSVDKTVNFEDGKPIQLPVQFDNPGLTPATKFNGNIVFRLMHKGQPPDFSHPQLSYHIETPFVIPHFHKTIPIPALKKETGDPEVLTPEIHKGMTDKNGAMYMIIWGKVDYIDAWKVPHWIQFCDIIGLGQAPTCSDYNQTDENEPK